MGKQRIKPNYRRRVLRLPDLDHCKLAMLNSLGSPASRRVYEYAIDQFKAWHCSEPRLAFNRIVVVRYRMRLETWTVWPLTEAVHSSRTATRKVLATTIWILLRISNSQTVGILHPVPPQFLAQNGVSPRRKLFHLDRRHVRGENCWPRLVTCFAAMRFG
jgi:hypothetical protein